MIKNCQPIIDKNGTKHWYLNGKLHREDGPAVEYSDGSKEWFLDGKLHRKDGPAIEYYNGNKEWWLNNKRHRTDGPAIECSHGDKAWWINHKFLFNTIQLNDRGLIHPSTAGDIQRIKFLLDNIYIIPKDKWNDHEYIDSVRLFV